MSSSSNNKSDFFRDLDELDQLSDDAQSNAADFSALLKTFTSPSNTIKQSHMKDIPPTFTRASTAPPRPIADSRHDKKMRPKTSGDTASKDQDHGMNDNNVMKRSNNSSNLGQRKGSKRRRTEPSRVIPESKQIFKGLTFFFIPNNGVAPARKLRIQRSQEYGALWAQTWSASVTHVIVDRGLNFEEICKVVSSEQLAGNIAIVNQEYPSECLQFGRLLSVTQSRFQVDGTPKQETKEDLRIPSTAGRSSPVIKNPQRRSHRSPTPSQGDDSLTTAVEPIAKQVATYITASTAEPNFSHDVLDAIVQEVKSVNDLPLDEYDDERTVANSAFQSCSGGDSSGDEDSNLDVHVPEWQKNFTCMQKHDGTASRENPNIRTIEILQKMADYYNKTADNWRTIAYRKAIAALRKRDTKISTKAEALAIPGIGNRLADKIEEIVSTDRLRRLENTDVAPEDKALQLFLGVYGAGFAQASKWIAKGYRTLEDLKAKAALSTNQRIGVDRYYDFQQRIPRDEVSMHGEIVRKAVHAADPSMQVMVAGSYRRGAADCGDIDVLITKPTGTLESIRALMLDHVVPGLVKQGFLKTSLAVTSRDEGSKWHGASALPDKDVWRRIDLLFVPGDEVGAALLYFTGNDIFNRSMRLLARKKGLCLNQRGLYKDILRGANQEKTTKGSLLEGRDEKRIFALLGVPWRPPEHRAC